MRLVHSITWALIVICGMVFQETACSVNLALKKPTKQSSVTYNFDNSYRAVDGNTNANFKAYSCSQTDGQFSGWHWWQVDLLDTYIVKYINITNRADCCGNKLQDFSIEVSEEEPSTLPGFPQGTNSAICVSLKNPVPTPGPVTLECTQPIKGRYVRVLKESPVDSSLIICEFEVYGKFPEPTNIALNKPATQSSTYESDQFPKPHSVASKAVDGNRNSHFVEGSCSHTQKGDNWHWWQVDLQDNYTISAVHIITRNDCCSDVLHDFTIEVSEEEPSTLVGFPATSNAAVCRKQKNKIPSSGPFMLECDQAVNGRYLRVVAENLPLTLCEVEVYGQITRLINIALGKPATQSSIFVNDYYPRPHSDAYKAVDGNINSHFYAGSCSHTQNGMAWHWWRVDLQNEYSISAVRITNRHDCCSDRLFGFTIEVSEEEPFTLTGFPKPTNTSVCLTRNEPIPSSGPFLLECNQPVKGRYLRIVWNVKKEYALTLCEVEVFGSLIEPTEAPVEGSINGKNGLWRFNYIANSGSMDVLHSSTLTRLMIDCARQRISDRTDLYTKRYILVDLPTGMCQFFYYVPDGFANSTTIWIMYKLE